MQNLLGGPQGGFDPQAGVSLSMAASWNGNPIPCFSGQAPQKLADVLTIAITYTNANTQVGTFKMQGTTSPSPASTTDWTDIALLGTIAVPGSPTSQPAVFTLTSASGTAMWNAVRPVFTSTSSGGADTAFIRAYAAAS